MLVLAGLAVLARPAASGAQIWRGMNFGLATAVATEPDGDVLAAGAVMGGSVLRLAGGTGATVWQTNLIGDSTATFIHNELETVAADGNALFVGGVVWNAGTNGDFTVAKLLAADGSVVWRRELDGTGADLDDPGFDTYDVALSVAVDAAGDLVAAGRFYEPAGDSFGVVKLAGADGTVLWRHTLDAYGLGRRVTLDAAGDVVAVGRTGGGFTAVKLAGATGTELWRYDTPGEGFGVAVDGAGDVLAAGQGTVPTQSMLVVKLAGPTGAVLWRADIVGPPPDGLGIGYDVAVDASGDVIAGGRVNDGPPNTTDFTVVRLAGTTGAELWRHLSTTGACCDDWAKRVVIDAAGDVVAAGIVEVSMVGPQFNVVKLAGSTGATLWERRPPGDVFDKENDVTIDPGGDVIPVGYQAGFAAFKFSGKTGGDYLLSGRRLVVKDGGPTARSLTLVSKETIFPPVPALAGADPTTGGAALELVNPTTGETATIPLPAAGWRAVGSSPGSFGYRYDDHPRALGPCSKVLASSGQLTARCRGAIGFSLDEPSQGSLGVRLVMGSDALRRCALFGGTVRKDVPGSFRAAYSRRPAACP